MGYLSATPEGQKKPRLSSWSEQLPPAGPLIYIWEWMQEIGLGQSISWGEVKAWSELTGITPTREEATAITQLSNAWLNERMRGTEKGALAPEGYYEWLQSQS